MHFFISRDPRSFLEHLTWGCTVQLLPRCVVLPDGHQEGHSSVTVCVADGHGDRHVRPGISPFSLLSQNLPPCQRGWGGGC